MMLTLIFDEVLHHYSFIVLHSVIVYCCIYNNLNGFNVLWLYTISLINTA